MMIFIHVLMKYMPYFKKLGKEMKRHITHEYYAEMSQKSEVVVLASYSLLLEDFVQ